MNNRSAFKLLCILAFISALAFSLLLTSSGYMKILQNSFRNESYKVNIADILSLLMNTTHCKIPDLNAFDPSVLPFAKRGREQHCSQNKSMTYTEGSQLKLDWSKIGKQFGGNFKYCQYTPIRRGPRNNDFNFVYGNVSEKFDHDITVPPEDEYMRVDCYNRADVKIATNYHATVTPKEHIEKRSQDLFKEHVKKHAPKETYNVQMVGVDSVSRLNFIRQMQQTRKFLHEELQAFELTGYNKVADNTFVNIVPILTGMFVEEMGWNEKLSSQPFDKYPFFWKNFSNAGYRTLYAEDAPNIGIFTYIKHGFHDPPADYYNRPLQVAMEKDKNIWSNNHCIVDRLETTMVLNYAIDFSRVFKDKPHFGFTFISRLTHDYLDMAGTADYAYVKFLKKFKEEGHLNNTVLIFYSDHGIRFGKIRSTYVGKIEERMPFFYLVFPPSFRKKYPELVKTLKTNTRRLTTPFDIHETLKDILYFDGVLRKANTPSRGISLFREIPINRTCENAGILPHWCVCTKQHALNTSSKLARDIGTALVRQINAILVNVSNVCANLSLGNVSEAIQMESNFNLGNVSEVIQMQSNLSRGNASKVIQMESNEKVFQQNRNEVINRTVIHGVKAKGPIVYQTTVFTLPGHALFEATLIYNPSKESYSLGGDISRINEYGNQSSCVDISWLKKFCFCG